jgi:hypothetical protein
MAALWAAMDTGIHFVRHSEDKPDREGQLV